ncbi:hypothetical protein [Xanthomonas sacchari]|uniref:hypothetical protein n=1 Tax=Xanthomonas sacchari TaxID=56458 RepID=UPI00111021E4|nr:hypothetical protein [Xanthomonas sacchari]MDV0438870.1 hypothetical protein [Xanthomonas sacchari]
MAFSGGRNPEAMGGVLDAGSNAWRSAAACIDCVDPRRDFVLLMLILLLLLLLLLLFSCCFSRVPSAAAELAGKTPRRGAAHKDVRRFRPGQDAPSENPVSGADPRSGREGGVCLISHSAAVKRLLLVTFLCTSKEK